MKKIFNLLRKFVEDWSDPLVTGLIALTFLLSLVLVGSEGVAVTHLTNCSTLNIPGESYVLDNNIINSSYGACMVVAADNVSLDCLNYSIDGLDMASTFGVLFNGQNGVTIKNCKITDWDYGLYMINISDNNVFLHNTINSNVHGINIYHSSYNLFIGNVVNHNWYEGIMVWNVGTINNNFGGNMACSNRHVDVTDWAGIGSTNSFTDLTCDVSSPNSLCDHSCPVSLFCIDSTPYDECSSTKPLYCVNGILIYNCSYCGCPPDHACMPDESCLPLFYNCSDGTIHGTCSVTQPLYCDNGTLINKCSLCDCPPGYDCQPEPEENCEITPPEPSDERRPIFASFYILLLIILFIIFFALSGSFSKSMAASLGCLLTIIVLPPVVNTLSAQMDIQLIIYIFIGVVLSTLAAIHRIFKNNEGE